MERKELLQKIRTASISVSTVCLIFAFVFLLNFVSIKDDVHEESQYPLDVSHRVLFISSFNPLYFTYDAQITGLEKSLYPRGIEYDVVYMDVKKHGSDEEILAFHDFLKARLKENFPYEAIILGDDAALKFALKYQNELFPRLPLIFFGINDLSLAGKAALNPLITGFHESSYLSQELDLALKLFPDTQTLVTLHDNSEAGQADMINFFIAYAPRAMKYAYLDLDTSKMSQAELIDSIKNLPPKSLLFYMACYSDEDGKEYSIRSRTNLLRTYAPEVPIFRNYEGGEGQGVLGGIFMNFEDQCRMVGETVAKVVTGTDISTIPIELKTPGRSIFDYALVKKYNLDFSLIPEDTIWYNRPESFMERYGQILPIAVLITLALLLLIASSQITAFQVRMTNHELQLSHDSLMHSQELLRYQAEYDEILDILNRRTITEWMIENLTKNQVYSVMIVDIDGFKELNENYGHQIADSILQYLVALFKSMSQDGDWKIARYGGDEFLLLIQNEHLDKDQMTVKKILEGIRAPIPLGDETLSITASVGISNSDGITTPEQHIINAEIAMYESKDHGRNGVSVFGDEMKEKMREENRIKIKLSEAFESDGFYMLYQPQINAKTKEVSGYEALVRMKEPGIYPGQFIPVAERSGWIWKIGRITTELAIRQLSEWRKAGRTLHPVSVNFSSNQLNDQGYIDFVRELLEKYDVPPEFLEIEITEGLFLEKSALADQIFKRFKSLGIRLLMDDFGTGYSSLGYLTYIPVDVIKLDKSLVDAYLVDGKDSFIRNIIRLMHDLNKEMIIEGVEEEWQFDRLREFGADTIQGYYFSKPIPADEAINFKV